MGELMLVRVDAGPDIGSGHFMRTLALAQAWAMHGGEVKFCSSGLPESLACRLDNEFFDEVHITYPIGTAEDALQTGSIAKSLGASCIVVDGYDFDSLYQELVSSFDVTLLFIDDAAHCNDYSADILLNQNMHADEYLYDMNQAEIPDYTRRLFGTKYVLLRKQFVGSNARKPITPSVAHTVLVTLGGSDTDNFTAAIVRGLLKAEIPDLYIFVVAGTASQLELPKDSKVHLLSEVDDMASVMAASTMAISGGGITVWELAFMGLPTIAFSRGFQEELLIASARRGGFVLDAWNASEFVEDEFVDMVRDLAFDPVQRSHMSRRGQETVGSFGAERVVNAIMETNKSYVER